MIIEYQYLDLHEVLVCLLLIYHAADLSLYILYWYLYATRLSYVFVYFYLFYKQKIGLVDISIQVACTHGMYLQEHLVPT